MLSGVSLSLCRMKIGSARGVRAGEAAPGHHVFGAVAFAFFLGFARLGGNQVIGVDQIQHIRLGRPGTGVVRGPGDPRRRIKSKPQEQRNGVASCLYSSPLFSVRSIRVCGTGCRRPPARRWRCAAPGRLRNRWTRLRWEPALGAGPCTASRATVTRGLEQLALVGLILDRDSHRDRLQALKARGRLEIRALLAAVQRDAALGTVAAEVDARAQRRGAVEAARGRHRLHQPRQARTGDVQGGTWTLRARGRSSRLGPRMREKNHGRNPDSRVAGTCGRLP